MSVQGCFNYTKHKLFSSPLFPLSWLIVFLLSRRIEVQYSKTLLFMWFPYLNPKCNQQMASVIPHTDTGAAREQRERTVWFAFPPSSAWFPNSLLFLSKQPLSAIPSWTFCFRISVLIFQLEDHKHTFIQILLLLLPKLFHKRICQIYCYCCAVGSSHTPWEMEISHC